MRRHRIICSHLLIMLVLLCAAVAASQALAGPDDRSARAAVRTYQESNANLTYSPAWKVVRNASAPVAACARATRPDR